jgi:hypothetical protein
MRYRCEGSRSRASSVLVGDSVNAGRTTMKIRRTLAGRLRADGFVPAEVE